MVVNCSVPPYLQLSAYNGPFSAGPVWRLPAEKNKLAEDAHHAALTAVIIDEFRRAQRNQRMSSAPETEAITKPRLERIVKRALGRRRGLTMWNAETGDFAKIVVDIDNATARRRDRFSGFADKMFSKRLRSPPRLGVLEAKRLGVIPVGDAIKGQVLGELEGLRQQRELAGETEISVWALYADLCQFRFIKSTRAFVYSCHTVRLKDDLTLQDNAKLVAWWLLNMLHEMRDYEAVLGGAAAAGGAGPAAGAAGSGGAGSSGSRENAGAVDRSGARGGAGKGAGKGAAFVSGAVGGRQSVCVAVAPGGAPRTVLAELQEQVAMRRLRLGMWRLSSSAQ